MPKLDDQISTLQDKLSLLKLRQQRIDERRQALLAVRERKLQTRRRLLVGAIVLAKAEQGELDRALLRKWLDDGLTRAGDRQLFDLAVKVDPV